MNTWALVVGCGAYPMVPGASARGPVDDAVAFRQWLLADGRVPPGQLRFLLSPPDDEPQVPQAIPIDGVADLPTFTSAVAELVTHTSADRLYVYFAGHGCPTDPDNPYFSQDVIALTDFDPDRPQGASVAVRELITQLAQSDVGEVVVILDAARDFPFAGPITLVGFGAGWHGKRRSGAVVQSLIRATSMASGSLTAALLEGLAGKAGMVEPDDDGVGTHWGDTDGADVDVADPAELTEPDRPGPSTVVRWSSLVEYLRSVLPLHPPQTSSQDTSLVLARTSPQTPPASRNPEQQNHARVTSNTEPLGEFEIRSTDPNAMLTIENLSGRRLAVGVGSIEGRLPVGSYVGVLVDPRGIDPGGVDPGSVDPRVLFELADSGTVVVVLDPTEHTDDFRSNAEPALRWSSAAAQLAATTASIWSHGHRSFLLVGWSGEVGPGGSRGPQGVDWVDSVVPQASEVGALTQHGGWWKAFPVAGPWCALRAGNRRITVPIAPDSVSAVAITRTQTSVALFDTTHAEPEQIAAQDRVQQYLAAGRLGAADLTSRLAVEADRRWPWGATAAVRRLIDGARRARDEGAYPVSETATHTRAGQASERLGDPPHQFVAQVPPSERHWLVGRGPWAVWLD